MAQYIYGKNVVITRLKEERDVEILYLLKGKEDDFVNKISKETEVVYVSKDKLNSLVANTYHQGYVAKVKEYEYYPLSNLLEEIKDRENPLILMLDGIKDPHNMGAILRTCDAVGVDGVIIGKNNSCPLNSTVARTSTGAIESVKVTQVVNLNQTIEKLKKIGFWVVGAEANNSKDYREIDYKSPILLIVGSEGEGISKLVLQKCDFLVKIPMYGQVNSLNVSVATAILLYQINNNKFPL